jgi:DNA-binding IclR family transcriptional regulator
MADDASPGRYRAPALDKGLDILELLAASDIGLSQAEIAKALDRTANEIYRMLDRLVRRNYVARVEGDRYELTLKLFALAHQRPHTRRLVSQAMPVMRRIAHEAEQSCHFVVADRGSLVVVAQVDGPGYWAVSIRVGSRIGLVNTGSGHILLAFASATERRLMLQEHERIMDEVAPDDLDKQLRLVRERGYEKMDSQQILGVMNLSVPIFGPNGSVVAALTSPFIKRLDKSDAPGPQEVLELLLKGGAEISSLAGFAPA